MIAIKHNDVFVDAEPLETTFPPGILDEKESPDAENAVRSIRALEKIIEESSAATATRARYSLLQSFPRLGSLAASGSEQADGFSLSDYCRALCPGWYREFLDTLSESEVEVFLKNYLLGHETWGHPEGVGTIVKTMLESVVHDEVPVVVKRVEGEEREIPDLEQSKLGTNGRFSVLGSNMVLGTRFNCRSRRYDIFVGPISHTWLGEFQRSGWADVARASVKLQRLVDFAEAFYLRGRVVFLMEIGGMILGKGVLGKSQIGTQWVS